MSAAAAEVTARVTSRRSAGPLPDSRGSSPYAPMSSAQQRLWFMDQLLPGLPLYHVSTVLQFRDEVDCDAVRQAFVELIERHEVLRTTFELVDLQPMQRINDSATLDFNVIDLRSVATAAKLATWTHSASQALRKPFDLGKAPLFRAILFQLADLHNILFIVMHHIICDAWSISVLTAELSALYEARLSGTTAQLKPLTLQYSDFAIWQHDLLEGGEWDEQLAYWQRKLADAPPSALPGVPQRSPYPSYRGGSRTFTVPAAVVDGLKAIGQREGATLFMTLLAAFKALLSRHSGEIDIVVGAPIAGRSRPEFESLIGCFVNPIVLRTDLSGNPDFLRLLRRVKEVCLEAYANQDVAFEKLVELLQPNRSLRNPLFQVAFSLQTVVAGPAQSDGNRPELPELSAGTAKFDLFLAITEQGRNLNAMWEFDKDLFGDEEIERLSSSMLTLLSAVAARPSVRLSELPLLSIDDEMLLEVWNATSGERQELCFIELFAGAAAKYSDRLAIAAGTDRISYSELLSRTEAVADALRTTGVGKGDLVAIYCRRSAAFVVGIIGTMMTGAAYVPIDPDYPEARQRAMLDEIPDAVVISEAKFADRVAAFGRRVVCVDGPLQGTPARWDAFPALSGSDLAYGIYTSGSTGRPKLAGVRHGGLSNLLSWYVREFKIGESDNVLVVTSPSFDLTQKNFLAPLLVGATVHLSPPGEFATHRIAHAVGRGRISILNCTPSLFYALADVPDGDASLSSLRLVVLGGEPIVARRLLPLTGSSNFRAEIVNTYGPTECSDVVAYHRVGDLENFVDTRVPIGKPIENVRLHILDEHLGRVPLGALGELCIAGAAVGAGYLNDRALSQQRFVVDPFVKAKNEYIYRTGDRARFLSDGTIDFLGRTDFQIKLHGFRIELEEIETVIRQHAAVQEVAVAPLSITPVGEKLAAFVVPNPDCAAPVVNLLRFEREGRLVDHAICELPNNMTIVHQNRSETDFLYRELFEERVYFRHGTQISPGAIIFDVGANIGLFGLSVARGQRDVQIYAFEPIPPIFHALAMNMQAYGVNARLFNVGLSDAQGAAEFTYYRHASILSGQYASRQEDTETVRRFLRSQADGGAAPQLSDEQVTELLEERLKSDQFTCALTTVSQIIRDHGVPRIDLLKIDVEKSELAVLHGIEVAHWPLIHQIVVEVHDIEDRVEYIGKLLAEKGFQVAVDQDQALQSSGMFSIYARRGHAAAAPGGAPAVSAAAAGVAPRQWDSLETLKRDVRKFTAEKLPDYMVPGVVILVDALPKTPSGKLDRKELQAIAKAHLDNRMADFVGPRNPLEEKLAAVWSEILGVAPISISDNFFDDLGGDSLLATQVIARFSNQLNMDLPLRLMFEHPTIGAFSAALADDAPPDDAGLATSVEQPAQGR